MMFWVITLKMFKTQEVIVKSTPVIVISQPASLFVSPCFLMPFHGILMEITPVTNCVYNEERR